MNLNKYEIDIIKGLIKPLVDALNGITEQLSGIECDLDAIQSSME